MTLNGGKLSLPLEKVTGMYIPENSMMYEIGFRTDDRIVGVNGEAIANFEDLVAPSVITSANLTYQVMRNGNEIDIPVTPNYLDSLQTRDFISPILAFPSTISSVALGTPAHEAGLMAGDTFILADSLEIKYWIQLTEIIRAAEQPINFTILRSDSVFTATIMPENNVIGIASPSLEMAGGVRFELGLFASIIDGLVQTWEQTTGIIGGFSRMISGDISVRQNLGGPIAIATITKEATDQMDGMGFDYHCIIKYYPSNNEYTSYSCIRWRASCIFDL